MLSAPHMNLAGFAVQNVIYAVDETIVARADTQRGERVVLKYQDTHRPAPELLARWRHEHAILSSIDSKWVIKTLGLKQFERNLVLVLEDFGSTNLAQLIAQQPLDLAERLAIAIQFDERDPAVKKLLSMAITAAKKMGKYIGICGQGPSDHPDLAQWLLAQGIESISLTPDTVVETWLLLARSKAG